MARRDAGPRSDVDLLVGLAACTRRPATRLGAELAELVGRDVDVIRLSEALKRPLVLVGALAEGRVLLDRDGAWPRLRARERELREAAERDLQRLREQAAESLRMLEADAAETERLLGAPDEDENDWQ